MGNTKGKSPSESACESRYLLMPDQANHIGSAFGGVIMAWIDMVAAMAAQRHCNGQAVTCSIDSISFKEPIFIGDQVVLNASVNYTGRTSMEVGVRVMRENPATGINVIATTAHLTFVAIDNAGRPVEVVPIIPETEDEKRRYENARIRVKARKELLARIQMVED